MQREGRGKISNLNYRFPNNSHQSAQEKKDSVSTGSDSQYEK